MKSVNFEFIRPHNEVLATLGGYAEAITHIDAGSALTRLRSFAEEFTKVIYFHEKLPRLPQATFYELVSDENFKRAIPNSLSHQIHFLRKLGNDAAHGGTGELINAVQALKIAYQLGRYLAVKFYNVSTENIPAFKPFENPTLELQRLKKSVKKYQAELDEKEQALASTIEELEAQRIEAAKNVAQPDDAKIQQIKTQGQQVADSLQWDEAKTRLLLIDAMLVKAGWDINDKQQVTLEQLLKLEQNPSGKGYADYVLWGDNGLPLAVIEAKRASNSSLQAGREQARLYADSLEVQYGQRPVIFYTNGYETFIWDDHQYNTYRPVYGLYSKDSLDYLIYQRHYREADLEKNNPKLDIAGRPYQIEAIKTVAAHYQNQRRKALVIQATGTGKTRVAIALSELLLRAGWAKRVLFLCDRKELRTQANDAFKEHLPSETRCVIGETGKVDQAARIYISTYPGMMNRFAQLDVGFFDLIIADESHRSIYNRYRDIFDYFDALQLGLTATPVKFISRNTFDMFGCESTDPTFEFGLDAAINNEPPYLVPFRVKDMTTEFLRDGIHYKDLTDEQKQQLEADLGEEEAKKAKIAGKDIGRKIFSESTDRQILENLMNNGIKDDTGSLVGKTIIFAQRQDHAEHLEKLFCQMYPQYGTKVCKVIHNKISHVDSVIKDFKKPDNDFRIAISVDMMDTGIDVPQVVNLVFAKPIKSWVKFWQMIGRGTRLCENLFGPGKHKQEFLIFDHYGNFAFFEEEYKEPEDVGGKSLLQTTFETRLELAKSAIKLNHAAAFDTAIERLRQDINDLNDDSIAVKRELRLVHQLQQTDALQQMQAPTILALEQKIAPLMSSRVLKDKHATVFDKLIAETQNCLIQKSSCFADCKTQILEAVSRLAITLKVVRAKDTVIAQVQSAEFWQSLTVKDLEDIRLELRGIMKYVKTTQGGLYETQSTKTQDGGLKVAERSVNIAGADEALLYRRKVKTILDDMIQQTPVLQKIHQGQPVNPDELAQLSSQILTQHPGVDVSVLNEFYGRPVEDLQTTIRELIGLNPEAVESHFQDFLHKHGTLTAKQVQFMNLLKTYLSQNGFIVVDKLYEAPFISVSDQGIDGVFQPDDADELFAVLKPYLRKEPSAQNPTV